MSGQPLSGRRIVVTRTRERAGGLVDLLHLLGAEVTVVPLITTVPLATPQEVQETAARISSHGGSPWVAFTSATAARLVINVLDPGVLDAFRIAAVGPATANALRDAGLEVLVMPDRHDAEGLARALVERGVGGADVWLPVAEGGREVLGAPLRAAGAAVHVQRLYRSEMPADGGSRLRSALARGADAITLTSGSTARHLVRALDGEALPPAVAIVCIGARTAAAARDSGLRVDAVAAEQSAEGLAEALSTHFSTLP